MLLKHTEEPVLLRRRYYDGFSSNIGYSKTTKSISLKINKVQVTINEYNYNCEVTPL